jgi:hypothetical protein
MKPTAATPAESTSGSVARPPQRRRWPAWVVVSATVTLLAAGAYLGTSGWLETRDSSTVADKRESGAPLSLDELEALTTQTIDRVETRWAKARDDVRAGLLSFDAAAHVHREECSAPLEALVARLRPAGADPYAEEGTRRERLLGRVNAQLVTMDGEALSMAQAEQVRANTQMDRLREAADREFEAIRKANAERAEREAKERSGMAAGGK